MKFYLEKLAAKEALTQLETEQAMGKIFGDEISDSEIAAFLIGLKTKGETVEEIAGIVQAMRKNSRSFSTQLPNLIDNCGTGGDGSKSFNISTTSAFVIAGAGITVAKHGNRSISSKTGSADVLEELGVSLDLPTELTEEILAENGISFLFAPYVHPKIKSIMKVRKDLKIPTVFNYIGPLTNPMDLDYQLLGISRGDMLDTFADVLNMLGRKRAVVLNGAGSMDEASLAGENHLVLLDEGKMTRKTLNPEDVGLPVYDNSHIVGGDAKENAEILLSVLRGEKGPCRDTVVLNAGIGIFAAGRAETVQQGIFRAIESIDSGAALEKLNYLIDKSSKYRKAVI
ncbi:anthranilate phosphoribosyltransferase [Mesobacillus maritimus]|uniref:anthranilate phosphoribosyltransferase n=1 Tax=Mesobacillus maritimus TaxID=1643336 RepID=UPI00203FA383|nr:anthranilate phosphoribosyltransferase [Mesobacillus maritimus]MCM3588071.1 anthranilate phosphoribosyltransferase [Mesobacillus maritimus]MCM3668402.1 anthranilate phosphoribosyltransferase [Mesobacillus maritimus]